jgi:hypothetical protein
VEDINFDEVAPRQLVDCMTLVKRTTDLWCKLVGILNNKFEKALESQPGVIEKLMKASDETEISEDLEFGE